MDPSGFASSDVNWMFVSILLMCLENSSFLAESKITQVSSTYLFHILGGHWAVLMAFTSKSSMKRVATMGLMGDPVAVLGFVHRTCPETGNRWFLSKTQVG